MPTKAQYAYLHAALSKRPGKGNRTQQTLSRCACVLNHNGATYIATSDGQRLHAVPAPDLTPGTYTIDAKAQTLTPSDERYPDLDYWFDRVFGARVRRLNAKLPDPIAVKDARVHTRAKEFAFVTDTETDLAYAGTWDITSTKTDPRYKAVDWVYLTTALRHLKGDLKAHVWTVHGSQDFPVHALALVDSRDQLFLVMPAVRP